MIHAPEYHSWAERNARHLEASLRWLRARFDALGRGNGEVSSWEDWLTAAHAGSAPKPTAPSTFQEIEDAEAVQPAPSLQFLAEAFGLSRFERDVVLLAAASELDPDTGRRCAEAFGGSHPPYPTFALALALFDDPVWDALAPSRPLRHWQLIDVAPPAGCPLVHAPLLADERIVHYLKGINDLDARLEPYLQPLARLEAPLPDSLRRLVSTAVRGIAHAPGREPVVELLGPETAGKAQVASEAAAELGIHLYRLRPADLPKAPDALDRFIRRWNREAMLLSVGLYTESGDDDASLTRLRAQASGVVFLAGAEPYPALERPSIRLDVQAPSLDEREAAWARYLGPRAGRTPERLAAQFELGLPVIADLATTTLAGAGDAWTPLADQDDLHPAHSALWNACRFATRPRLDVLAQRLEPRARWEDLVLPDAQAALLHAIADGVAHRGRVIGRWGFGRRTSRGLGLSVLFAGESGTGKTMAAEVIANALNLDLYRIDLATVVSKYIGETEKHLRRLFDAAEGGGTLLFFDEADALFGKRSEVKDSHDRYANIEVNYLLQRIESYRGLAVLATNRRSALDEAFVRRLRYIVTFPFPGQEERRRIWCRAFPEETPVARLDFDRLSRFTLSGGVIHTIALNAAFAAAAQDGRVTMPIVLDAVRIELEKLEQPVNEALLQTNGEIRS